MVTNRDRKLFGSSQRTSIVAQKTFSPSLTHFETHFVESFNMSKSSWKIDQTRSRKIHSCSANDLPEIQGSFKISSRIWSLISSVVTVLGHPTQVENARLLKWATQFLTVAYNGACSPNFSVRMPCISFGALPCRKELMTLRVWILLKSIASHYMLLFSPCNKKSLAIRHMKRPSLLTTLSIPSYVIGKKFRLWTYQLPHLYVLRLVKPENTNIQ